MDTLPMFPLAEFEEDSSHMPEEEAVGGSGDVPGQNQIDNQIRVEREQCEDNGQTPAEAEAGSNAPAGTAAGGEEQVGGDEVDSVYKSNGLDGPFEWDPLVRVFPDSPQGDFDSRQSRFSCVGLLGGSPLASRPGGVCLGFPLSGWFPASAGCGRPASASPCSGGCGPSASGSGPPGM